MEQYTECINPANGEIIGRSKLNRVEELSEIVRKAKIAQIEWGKISIEKRVQTIIKIRDYIVSNSNELAEVITKDNGKSKVDALASEVLPAAMAISYYCKNAKSFLKESKLSSGNIFLVNKRSKIIRVPFGVVGIISPWNYPFAIPFSEVIMGLLAGNAVILKTASETQLVGVELKKAVESAGLPEGLFTYINLPGRIAGDAFFDSGIDKLFFTGSVAIGKYLMEKAAKNLTPLCLELGGNDPMIVCEDADIYRSVMGAIWGGFQNSGQSCGGVERIYVHEKVYTDFLNLLKSKVESLRIGNGLDSNIDIGCMTTSKQVHTVKEHVDDALKQGAVMFAKSYLNENASSNFLQPMVLTNVNHNMLLMKDETFGPVVGVMKFSNYEEAINLANDSYLGLTASVWSKSNKRGEIIARQLKAGAVTLNDHLMSHGLAETPWGGFKQSSLGRTHGKLGFDEMTQPLVIVKDILPFVRKNLWWHPYSQKLFSGLSGLLDLLYSKSISKKIKGAVNLIKIFPRMFRSD